MYQLISSVHTVPQVWWLREDVLALLFLVGREAEV